MSTQLKSMLDSISTIFNRIPTNATALVASGEKAKELELLTSLPVANEWVCETDDEVTALRDGGRNRFFDSRGPYIHLRTNGIWRRELYVGNSSFCRPGTLVMSTVNNRLYYLSANMVMNKVNLSTESVPR